MTITKAGKTYQIEVEYYDRWNYLVRVYEICEDNKVLFMGKAISNDITYAIEQITK